MPTPSRKKRSAPQSSGVKASAPGAATSSTRQAAAMTSGPMPSPGIRAMRLGMASTSGNDNPLPVGGGAELDMQLPALKQLLRADRRLMMKVATAPTPPKRQPAQPIVARAVFARVQQNRLPFRRNH